MMGFNPFTKSRLIDDNANESDQSDDDSQEEPEENEMDIE